MYRTISTAILTLASFLAGCASSSERISQVRPSTPVLLFDDMPLGNPVVARSSWPSAVVGQTSQNTRFREIFIDVQYPRPFIGRNQDFVYRRFETRRSGRVDAAFPGGQR